MTEKKGTYYGDCEITTDDKKFVLKCKKGQPAVKIQVEED